MHIFLYVIRRLLYVIPQVIGISLVTFVIVRVLPSNPAFALQARRRARKTFARSRSVSA